MIKRFIWNSRNGNHNTLVFKTVKKIPCVTSLSLKTSLFMTDLFQNNATETETKLLPIIRVCMQTTLSNGTNKHNLFVFSCAVIAGTPN